MPSFSILNCPEGGTARFYCVPESAEQFRNFAKSAELAVREGMTFYLNAADHGGMLVQTLEQIAAAKINLLAIQAVAIQGEFGCFLWAAPEDSEALQRLLA
jgi:prephenate dehydratase